MLILSFLLQLFGATFLLLFAVRMVRTGIERAFGSLFRRLLTGGQSPLRLVPLGTALAIVLQSSAAVTLLAAGFAANGAIAFLPAVAIVLGGDLGSALLIQLLSLEVDWLVPVFLTLGGVLFLKTERRSLKQAGRIILGVAFILIALRFLREAIQPIQDSGVLPAVSIWLESDPLTAFFLGAALAFVMHSSVAAVLMVVTVVGMSALPFGVGAAIVLGANLGSALIPVWLGRGMAPAARRVIWANLALRGTAALITLAAISFLTEAQPPQGWGPGQALVTLHIVFNLIVVLALPIVTFLQPLLNAIAPDAPPDAAPPRHISALDATALASPARSLASLRREVLRMADILVVMLTPVMDLYRSYDSEAGRHLRKEDNAINTALDDIRRYSASMPHDAMSKTQMREMRALVDYAIALEAAGDIVVKRLSSLAAEKNKSGLKFSVPGREELTLIHERVLANL
ncbi:MAG: Na/Pi cotransporter family protein, partial [Silicimonas sp.]|nr:Na/Pi cotransporter family protein [Silicimonas sp.]